jgi:tight adherence protein C
MELVIIVPILLVLFAAAAALMYFGVRSNGQTVTIEERLARFAEQPMTLEEIEMSLPFKDRVLTPAALKLARWVSRFTPRSNMEKLRQQLIEAGSPTNIGASEFMGLRFVLMGIMGGSFFLIFAITGAPLMQLVLFPAAVGAVGYVIPGIWLSRKIKSRKKEIQLALPDAIDLLTISVEAGLGFDPALQRVAEKWENQLTLEFRKMLSEMRYGSSRRKALRDLANRINVDDLNVFVASLVQADQLGVSIAQVLRVQSRQMRIRRRQRAEEQAHRAPVKMLFPMVFLIFPAMYVIILGPAVPQIFNSGAF